MLDTHTAYTRITCSAGGARFLASELHQLGYQLIVDQSLIHVGIELKLPEAIRICCLSRLAHRVLFHLKRCKAKHPDELYKNIKQIPWENYLKPNGYFSIDSAVENHFIRDTRFANLRVKDAIADRFMSRLGKRPDSGPEHHEAVIYLHWKGQEADIYLDLSGETLEKHQYRKHPWQAPLLESLAATILRASGWQANRTFINPMCGSGTLAIEAALLAKGIFPIHLRKNFGFKHILLFQDSWLERMHIPEPPTTKMPDIIATDIHPKAVKIAQENAKAAGVLPYIQFKTCSFEDTPIPTGGGTLIMNPEYGQRLGDERELSRLYPAIGDFLKQKCTGYNAFIFSGNIDLLKTVGLKPYAKFDLFNAKIPCKLFGYELYSGKNKIATNTSTE